MDDAAAAAGSPRPELGARLAAEEARLRLLLTHLAGRALRARVDVDDLLQEVYLRVLARPAGAPLAEPGEGPLRRYLVSVARHAVIDVARSLRAAKRAGREERLRSSAAGASTGSGPGASRLAARTAGPATRLALDEDLRRIQARFEALSPEHRRVIGLRQFEGLSARDTARRLGKSESAVHSLYRRALLAWGLDDAPQ